MASNADERRRRMCERFCELYDHSGEIGPRVVAEIKRVVSILYGNDAVEKIEQYTLRADELKFCGMLITYATDEGHDGYSGVEICRTLGISSEPILRTCHIDSSQLFNSWGEDDNENLNCTYDYVADLFGEYYASDFKNLVNFLRQTFGLKDAVTVILNQSFGLYFEWSYELLKLEALRNENRTVNWPGF